MATCVVTLSIFCDIFTVLFIFLFIFLWTYVLEFKMNVIAFVILSVLTCILLFESRIQSVVIENVSPTKIFYSAAILKSLRPQCKQTLTFQLPKEISRRKRGKKGGARARNRRRPNRPFVPSFMMGNARSLNNKTDELTAM